MLTYLLYNDVKKGIMILVYGLIVAFIALFTITFFLLIIFINYANKLSLMDIPNTRSSHKSPVARGAGIVFGFVFLFTLLLYDIFLLESYAYYYVFFSTQYCIFNWGI